MFSPNLVYSIFRERKIIHLTKKQQTIVIIVTIVMTVEMLSPYIPLRINTTQSMPIGVYLVAKEAVKRGSIVSVCLPDALAEFGLERHYL